MNVCHVVLACGLFFETFKPSEVYRLINFNGQRPWAESNTVFYFFIGNGFV